MNCQEFKELTKKKPYDCTRAERASHYSHMLVCEPCRESIMASVAPAGLEMLFELMLVEAPKIDAVIRGDVEDPEYLQQIADVVLGEVKKLVRKMRSQNGSLKFESIMSSLAIRLLVKNSGCGKSGPISMPKNSGSRANLISPLRKMGIRNDPS